MKNKPTITLVIPTINEIEGLKVVFPRIDRSLFDEVLVIDASSTDGTAEYISKHPDVKFVTQKSKGMQNAMMEMLEIVTTDYIVEFSPDNNCIPEQLPDIVSRIYEGYDIVVVSRYLGEATSEDDTIISGFGNWMFSKMIRYLGKFPITDALTLYKGYKASKASFFSISSSSLMLRVTFLFCKSRSAIAQSSFSPPVHLLGLASAELIAIADFFI